MPLFLSDRERQSLDKARQSDPLCSIYWALVTRVEKRAATPGLRDDTTTVHWWHCAAEYLTDAAMVYAIKPSKSVKVWLRSNTLEIVRRPIADWVGPAFREFDPTRPVGHLETAHLSWGIAVVLDLAADLFNETETEEIRKALKEKGITLCQRWIERANYLNNWRCVLNAGVAVAAAVLDDQEALDFARDGFERDVHVFQADGSYSESLQYSNYTAYTLMLTREALSRHNPALETSLPLDPYAKKPRWDVASLFYTKPLLDWGNTPRPRSANFNDSAAMYRASADLLIHLAARAKTTHPVEAGLARWLFDTLYLPHVEQGPHDQASFGFVNDFGFLTIAMFADACEAISPEQAKRPLTDSFSCGDVLVRDTWSPHEERTILAIHTADDDGLLAPGHLHGDLNSFILVHNKERLLVDPGHSCYRGFVHDLETQTRTHNTCTFWDGKTCIEQSKYLRRSYNPTTKEAGPPVSRGGKRLLIQRDRDVTVVASEIAELYGDPLQAYTRFWFQCGRHVLFVVDQVQSKRPVRTEWNWLFNNRDGALDLKLVHPDRLVARRGNAGMKLFHIGDNRMQPPKAAFVHDAYHPLPGQRGEGKANSGQLVRWTEKEPSTNRCLTHAICMDTPGMVTHWHLRKQANSIALESQQASTAWQLSGSPELGFTLSENVTQRSYTISQIEGVWQMSHQS